MLEILLALACLNTNSLSSNACTTSAQAYSQYKNVDKIVQRNTDKVKDTMPLAYYSGMVALSTTKKQFNSALYSGLILSMKATDNGVQTNLSYQWGF